MQGFYRIFGLSLGSDFDLPELLPAPETICPDIQVLRGTVQHPDAESPGGQGVVSIADGICQFEIQRVARYRVQHGTQIVVDPAAGAAAGDVRVWLLGTAIGVLMHQRGLLPLHVSAVACAEGAAAFCGHSGAGKSTLAAALHQRGLPLLTDDVALVTAEEHSARIHPGFPRIKLWRDALEHFGMNTRNLIPDLTRTEKYHLRVGEKDGFHADALPLRRLYLLERSPDERIHIEPVYGHRAIRLIGRNTYRVGIARRIGMAGEHLALCGQIARRIRVYRFQRPWRLDRINASTDTLLQHLQTQPRLNSA